MSFLRAAFRCVTRPHIAVASPRNAMLMRQTFALQRAWYSESVGLSKPDIQARIFDVIKSFEKVDPSKASVQIKPTARNNYL